MAKKDGDITFYKSWDYKHIENWLRDLFPEAFAYLDRYDNASEPLWWLLKVKRTNMNLHRSRPTGMDLGDAKGPANRPWDEGAIYIGAYLCFCMTPAVDLVKVRQGAFLKNCT